MLLAPSAIATGLIGSTVVAFSLENPIYIIYKVFLTTESWKNAYELQRLKANSQRAPRQAATPRFS